MAPSLANLTPEQLNSLSNVPALQPPPGVVPNFLNPENQIRSFLVATSLELGIMTVFVLVRFYSKSFLVRKYSWDDLTVLLAVVFSIAYYATCVWGALRGKVGVHQWDISVPEVVSYDLLIPQFLTPLLAPPTLLFTKITFFLLYLQIFKPMRWLRISAYIGTLVTTAFYIGQTIAQFIFVTPRPGETWFDHAQSQVELKSLVVAVPVSAIGLCIDLYILVLPVIAVNQLQLATQRKFGVILIFMTGILACLGSALSIYYRYVLDHSADLLWNLGPVYTVTQGFLYSFNPHELATNSWKV
ncbi:hypothetical protein MMC07_008876 [Pseudocyphellaria aurata]|nr:hypothetical protein [Pseudocyphellaria aurata]